MSDQALHERIEGALAADPRVDDDEIAVECSEGGDVTLSGTVRPAADRDAAVAAAACATAVAGVEDDIHVLPSGDRA